jgi:hypothetical protein
MGCFYSVVEWWSVEGKKRFRGRDGFLEAGEDEDAQSKFK